MKKSIELEDGIKLIYKEPEIFSKYHGVYHAQKYSNLYFRYSQNSLLEKAKYIDSGYLILRGEKIIGGVFIKPNYMCDLFVVPPYKDYEELVRITTEYLKSISDRSKKILVQEVVEDCVQYYESRGFKKGQNGFWMIRPTDSIEVKVPDGYEAREITDADKNEIGTLIMRTYKENPMMGGVRSEEEYVKSVEYFINNHKDNTVLDNSSRILVHKESNEIIGVCMHMEFEELPLITEIAVRPDHQGKGIGSYLMKNAISSSNDGYPAIRLFVDNHNEAIGVYESLGFIKNRTINDMYLD